MLIGQLPFRGKNKAAIQKAITTQKIMPSFVEIDGEIDPELTTKDPIDDRQRRKLERFYIQKRHRGGEETRFSRKSTDKTRKTRSSRAVRSENRSRERLTWRGTLDKKWTDAKVHAEAESAAASPSPPSNTIFGSRTSTNQLAYFESRLSADENERSEVEEKMTMIYGNSPYATRT